MDGKQPLDVLHKLFYISIHCISDDEKMFALNEAFAPQNVYQLIYAENSTTWHFYIVKVSGRC
jgi:hypothetical protein